MLDNKEIGKNLERTRLKLGLNKAKFATPAGIDTSQYGRAERGEEGLGREKLHLLAEKHGVNPDFLFMGREPILKNEIQQNSVGGDSIEELTLGQILSLLAKANDKYAETLTIHARILDRIESKMAREETQAMIKDKVGELESSLDILWNGLFVASTRQSADRESVLAALSKLMGKPENHLLKEANKKVAGIFEASGVQDKMPAKRK